MSIETKYTRNERPHSAHNAIARLVLEWARTPQPHGGNPHTMPLVCEAQKIVDAVTAFDEYELPANG